MKSRLLIIIGIILFSISFDSIYAQCMQENNEPCNFDDYETYKTPEFTEAHLTWEHASYALKNGTTTAKIILTDSDSNYISNYKEKVKVFVFSDSFREEIILELYETEKDSGIFERTFTISDYRSAPSILSAQVGDTAIVYFVDSTLPSNYSISSIDLQSTTLIDIVGMGPLERVPVSSARITDINRNSVDFPIVGQQYLIASDFANGRDYEQNFVWFAQIQDETNTTVSLSWINGTLNPLAFSDSEISWIPQRVGKYTTTFFIWESLVNPSALAPPISIDFEVIVPVTPEPQSFSLIEHNLIDAKKLLQIAYYENVNLGPLKFNDVIVGFGIENDTMIMDVLYRYSVSSEMDIVKKKIQNIVDDEIKIEYIPYKESSRFIQNALVYHWNEYLHKNNIEFASAYPSHGNNDDGIGDGTFLCSPLVAPNGTEFYIVSTVIVEPFLITDTFVDIEKPEFCRKTWKTDVILEEPDRVISLWLEMGQGRIATE